MFSFSQLLLHHGYWVLFVYVLGQALGLPIPADPVFLLMGAMVGNHQYSFGPALLLSVAAILTGDIVWYLIARARGR